MSFRDEVKVGDRLNVMWRNTKLDVFTGTVVAIDKPGIGQAYIVVPDGKTLSTDGAVHVSEYAAVLAVWRTEVWLTLPLPFSRAEVELKCKRMDQNEVKRREAKMPLFASVVPARVLDVDEVEQRFRKGEEEDYLRAKRDVDYCLQLRARVQSLMTPEEFEQTLSENSQGFKASTDPLRRTYLWRDLFKQLEGKAA